MHEIDAVQPRHRQQIHADAARRVRTALFLHRLDRFVSGGGEAHSSEAVRDRIREMIDGEKPADVLSDDAIVDMLRKSGVDIARRTVAKYREGMSIPSSVQRRREKRARVEPPGDRIARQRRRLPELH